MISKHLINDTKPNSLLNLRNQYQGQKCFIMGNGPSLNKTNLDILVNEYVWGVNKCYLLFDRIQWRPAFYVTNDQRLTQHIAHDLEQLINKLPFCLFFFPSIFRDKNILSEEVKAYWFNEKTFERDREFMDWIFSTDPSKWVAHAATVTITCLQLAAYLGFNPIYLIGCDTLYTVPDTVLLEDSSDHLISTQNDDTNHFTPEYLGTGVKWTTPDTELMISQYKKSKLILDSMGVNVYNATVGGNLEVFPRIQLENI